MGAGKRWQLTLAGSEQLIAEIEDLVPVLFTGTEKPSSTKVQVAFVAPASLLGQTFYASLYNPDATGVTPAKFGEDVAKVRVNLGAGFRFALVNSKGSKVLPKIAEQYLAACAAIEDQTQPQAANA